MKIECEISLGELIDKISILKIKSESITDEIKNKEINKELNVLTNVLDNLQLVGVEKYLDEIYSVNKKLFKTLDIQFSIKNRESLKFNKCSQDVIDLNNDRFKIKNKINNDFNSNIKEQKGHI